MESSNSPCGPGWLQIPSVIQAVLRILPRPPWCWRCWHEPPCPELLFPRALVLITTFPDFGLGACVLLLCDSAGAAWLQHKRHKQKQDQACMCGLSLCLCSPLTWVLEQGLSGTHWYALRISRSRDHRKGLLVWSDRCQSGNSVVWEMVVAVLREESNVVLICRRVLGTRPSYPPLVCLNSSTADRDRRGSAGRHAPGVLPFHAGRLETGDSANVQ